MPPDARGLLLRPFTGEPFWFDAGALCLELLTTGGEGEYAIYEILHTPDDLAAWLPQSRLAADGTLTATDVRVTEEELADVKRLRAALWRACEALVDGGRPDPGDLRILNECGSYAPPVPRIEDDLRRGWRTPLSGGQAVAAMARGAIDLFGSPLAGRIRRCAGGRCEIVFVDTSRPGRRRWCSMERCGNRAKTRAYRDRHQS